MSENVINEIKSLEIESQKFLDETRTKKEKIVEQTYPESRQIILDMEKKAKERFLN